MVVTGNKIQWKHTGTVTIGAGIEVSSGQTAPIVNPAPYEKIVIARNTFHFAEGATHPIFLGIGAGNAEVTSNVLISPKGRKYGVVVKSDDNLFEFNSVYGGEHAFYLAGASRNKIRHNTVFAFSGCAFAIDAHQERSVPPAGTHGQARDNVVEDNIFVSADGLAFCHDPLGDDDSRSWDTLCDRNVYWSVTGANVVCLNRTPVPLKSGIAAVRELWSRYAGGGRMKDNDGGSVVADPLLSNPPEDFSLRRDSPARGVDKASKLNAGAWQENARPRK
jgi:hypothetical protein